MFLLLVPVVTAQPSTPPADLTLEGVVTRTDHETYREAAFNVPPGTTRITIEFAYDRSGGTTLDLGLADPQRFRGWSGGNKSRFTLSSEDATPSYLTGPLPAGRWRLVIGAPNVRAGARTAYTARIWFSREPALALGFADAPLRDGPAWYRGDLHLHTGHSDGTCLSQAGARVPCPLYRSLEAASASGLDFVAITDHNTTSQFAEMRALEPAFDHLLLIPGREITTFRGHANLLGPTGFVDFRVGTPGARTIDSVFARGRALGGLNIINHPSLPTGEPCMGCGWTWPDANFDLVDGVEVINGGAWRLGVQPDRMFSGISWWQSRLLEGRRLTAVGGSDNHDAGLPPETPSAIGRPTTVVFAANLSTPAVLQALREGHVFVDMSSGPGRLLELTARAGEARAIMGDELRLSPGAAITFEAHVAGVANGRLEVIRDGQPVTGIDPAISGVTRRTFEVRYEGRPSWVRLNVRNAEGHLILLGNPIYLRSAP